VQSPAQPNRIDTQVDPLSSNPTSNQIPVTQADVAKALGIADSTVSRALKNNPKIPEEHRKKIQEAAERMGYRMNPMAAALAQWRKNSATYKIQASLAWLNLWPDPKKLRVPKEFNHYWLGARAAAEKLGYHLEEFIVNEQLPLSRLEKILTARGITGILIPPHPFSPNWKDFPWENFSAIRYGRSCVTPNVHVVTSDHVANVMLALQKIREKGYRRVGFVTGGWTTRRGGWLKAGALLHESNLEKQDRVPHLVFKEKPTNLRKSCMSDLSAWMKKYKPEAIFTDVEYARSMLDDLGYRVPEDVGLAVCSILDGNADAGIFQNPTEIGRVGVLILISLINSHDRGIPPIPHEILITGNWVDGKTLPAKASL
jgi:DNA-binding LacI/PurR family transcriptional regulator